MLQNIYQATPSQNLSNQNRNIIGGSSNTMNSQNGGKNSSANLKSTRPESSNKRKMNRKNVQSGMKDAFNSISIQNRQGNSSQLQKNPINEKEAASKEKQNLSAGYNPQINGKHSQNRNKFAMGESEWNLISALSAQ